MSTPKDMPYKLRNAEFKALNKQKYKVPAGIKPSEFFPVLEPIKHAQQYVGKKGR